jgi:hypothetical protein
MVMYSDKILIPNRAVGAYFCKNVQKPYFMLWYTDLNVGHQLGFSVPTCFL